MLGLVYAGILMLVVAVTALRGQWHKQDLTTKVTAGPADIQRRY